jgi:hypothetical protein
VSEHQLNIDDFHHLPTRQWNYLVKTLMDRNLAARIANNSKDIRDHQRWARVAELLDWDIYRISKPGWRA